VAADLLDAADILVNVAGILAQDAALEHQRIGFDAAVAHFAIAHQPLVGDELDERAPLQVGDAHIHDFQLRGLAVRVDVVEGVVVGFGFLRHDTVSYRCWAGEACHDGATIAQDERRVKQISLPAPQFVL